MSSIRKCPSFFKRKIITACIIVVLFLPSLIQSQEPVNIIPQPVKLIRQEGFFLIDVHTGIQYDVQQKELKPAVVFFANAIANISGIDLIANKHSAQIIRIVLRKEIKMPTEGYQLTVKPQEIEMLANSPAGIFYAMQSLLQTLPAIRTNALLKVPCMEVKDFPRFSWRGMHLDVSRHFFSPEVIRQYIDLMAAYKMNTFHWHLVDDQGWRIEIKKYPKLTETGAWRVDKTNMVWGERPQAQSGEVANYGGYYTQQQIREIVKYAAARNITVVPEIEMPGHVASAIASYPWLSCTQESQLPLTGGNYTNLSSNYCAGNDEVFHFLENILTEVMDLFPSSYIHIGGDEVDKAPWKKCARCQQRMQQEKLKTEEELQSYFIRRMEKFINQHQRKVIGWDEILEGGLAPNAAVMSWRGETGGIEAAKMKHKVVMSPGTPCYFDHYQAGPEGEPLAIGGFNTLKKVYDYEPVPKELSPEESTCILGAQGNVWTEYIATAEQLEYMVLPRMPALAEALWSPSANKDWNNFYGRIKKHFAGFDQKGLHYSKGNYRPEIRPSSSNGKLLITITSEIPGIDIRYNTDGTTPVMQSKIYSGPFYIDSTQTISVLSFLQGKAMISMPAAQTFYIHKAIGAAVEYKNLPQRKYMADGMNALTDGARGKQSLNQYWHGFEKNNLDATIDLGTEKNIHSISLGCLQHYKDWIFLPASVSFEVSADGKNFEKLGAVQNDIPVNTKERTVKNFALQFPEKQVRYIRVIAHALGSCPEGHPGAGNPAWTFADELIVE